MKTLFGNLVIHIFPQDIKYYNEVGGTFYTSMRKDISSLYSVSWCPLHLPKSSDRQQCTHCISIQRWQLHVFVVIFNNQTVRHKEPFGTFSIAIFKDIFSVMTSGPVFSNYSQKNILCLFLQDLQIGMQHNS